MIINNIEELENLFDLQNKLLLESKNLIVKSDNNKEAINYIDRRIEYSKNVIKRAKRAKEKYPNCRFETTDVMNFSFTIFCTFDKNQPKYSYINVELDHVWEPVQQFENKWKQIYFLKFKDKKYCVDFDNIELCSLYEKKITFSDEFKKFLPHAKFQKQIFLFVAEIFSSNGITPDKTLPTYLLDQFIFSQ